MSAYAGHIPFDTTGVELPDSREPECMVQTPWGYTISTTMVEGSPVLRSVCARFFGMMLFLSGLTIGLIPDGSASSGLIAMKIGAMVMFMLFGGVLVWAGRQKPGAELHVDVPKQVMRIGGRDLAGNFKLSDVLDFDEVDSIFLMRNANTSLPARLFLRLDGDVAIEIAQGKRQDMERIRQRLTFDLAYSRH